MSLTRILNGFATKTGTYNIVPSDSVLLANGTFIVYLPPAADATGRPFTIRNINTGVVTVSANGAELIDGATTLALAQNESVTVSSTGEKYHRLSPQSLFVANSTAIMANTQLHLDTAGGRLVLPVGVDKYATE